LPCVLLVSMPQLKLPPGYWQPLSWAVFSRRQLDLIGHVADRFGPISGFQMGWVRYYVLSHPDHVLHVLQEKQHNFSKQTHDYWLLKNVMGTSLLTGDGAFWKQRRQLIQPAFQKRQLEHLERQTQISTDLLVERWTRLADSGQPFEAVDEMVQLTLRIIGRTLFSTDLIDEAPAVGAAVHTSNRVSAWNYETVWSLLPLLNWPFRRAMGQLDRLMTRLVVVRRQSGGEQADLLSALVHARDPVTGAPLTDREIRNEAMTLMLAGHDTTAHHLAWTLFLLAQHPEVVRRWQAELDTVLKGRDPTLGDLPQLTYTRMIVEESMRLYPPIWAIPRYVIADDELSGYRIPAGSYVLLAIHHIQRDGQWWDSPDEFRPERFDRQQSPPPKLGSYAPFGWGPRTCVAAQFAIVESQLILARLGQRFEWTLEPKPPVVPDGLITLLPRYGMRLRLMKRQAVKPIVDGIDGKSETRDV
jgi:cytochrome P450